MPNYGVKISKPGVSVLTGENTDLIKTSKFYTFLISRTGELVINLPAETLTGTSKTYTATYSHNLGYVPFHQPTGEFFVDYGDGGDYIVNDICDQIVPAGAFGPTTEGERAIIYVTTSSLVLKIVRNSMFFGIPFNKRKATLYYTIFSNRVNEEFDLLT